MAEEIVTDVAYTLVMQAQAVCEAAHRNTGDRASEYWGLNVLLQGLAEHMERLGIGESEQHYDQASKALAGALALVANTDRHGDDPLIMATHTILKLAMVQLRQERQAFVQSALEVQHG